MYLKNTLIFLFPYFAYSILSASSFFINVDFTLPEKLGLDYSSSLNNLGNSYFYQGKYDLALQTYKKCQNIRQEEQKKDDLNWAATLYNIGVIYHRKTLYREAFQSYQASCRVYAKLKQKKHLHYATVISNIGLIYQKHGQYDRALQVYHQATTIYQEKIKVKNTQFVETLNQVALFYQRNPQLSSAPPSELLSGTLYQNLFNRYYLSYAIVLSNIRICKTERSKEEFPIIEKELKAKKRSNQSQLNHSAQDKLVNELNSLQDSGLSSVSFPYQLLNGQPSNNSPSGS